MSFLAFSDLTYITVSTDLISAGRVPGQYRFVFSFTVSAVMTRDALALSGREAFSTVPEPSFSKLDL